MADFVLVHGAWHGAWCWRNVVPALWRAGHRAFAVTLTGVGERAHLLSRSVTLETHVSDVVNTIEAEELPHVVLVGHSYGGMIITGAADRLFQRVRHLVYIDAIVPHSGESWSSTHDAQTQQVRRKAVAETGCIPAPDPTAFGLHGADLAWVARRQTAQPGKVYDAPLNFDAQRLARLRRTFIDCTAPALPTIAAMRERVRAEQGWQVVEIATGHDPMISAPAELVDALLAVAQG
jgi:pimeloyl-ACP methyl ester carboxylesterase